ncbi:MAG: hypothetical protein WD405_01325 [Homoserinimonas sp.]
MTDAPRGGRPPTGGNGSARPPTLRGLTEPSKRGRPRSVGEQTCDRCHRTDVPRIHTRWPDGAICGICFTEATHTYGRCLSCGEENCMLPGRDADGHAICRSCAGISTHLVCEKCGREAERFRGKDCVRCVIESDLNDLLRPGTDFRLRRLIDVLVSADRPESIYTYTRGKKAHELLSAIGARELPLTHEAFDRLGASTAARHLQALLVHHRMLPERGDEHIHRFEQWIATRLATLPDDGTRAIIERYATWHHLKRVRRRALEDGVNMETVTHAAKQKITEAGKFLLWLRSAHGIGTELLRQAHVDEYLAEGTTTRKHVRNFTQWLNRHENRRTKTERIDAPIPEVRSGPLLKQSERIDLVRNCLEWNNVARSTRVAALILLLWAQPLNKIVMLRRDRVAFTAEGMTLSLGRNPSSVPEPVADLFWQHLENPGNQRTTNTGTHWIFPGRHAGRPLHPDTLSDRLKVLGVDAQRTRNATLRDLAQEVDARSLIDLLGYSKPVIARHAARAGTPMSDIHRAEATGTLVSVPAGAENARPRGW